MKHVLNEQHALRTYDYVDHHSVISFKPRQYVIYWLGTGTGTVKNGGANLVL